jgi:hypothetical protein
VKPASKKYVLVAACVALLAAAFVAYHVWLRSNTSNEPAKITQISQWNKPMNHAKLSPDGHNVAFSSPVGGIAQVFLMLTSGGEPLQLTNDEGDKHVDAFSPDGKEVYYGKSLGRGEVWAVPTLGGAPRHVAVWKWSVDGSNPEKVANNCTSISDIDPGGQYLFGAISSGEKSGIYEVSISDRKCISLLPGVVTFNVTFARDGKSFLYAVASRGEVTIFRQPWRDGKIIGAPQVAFKVPFAFPLLYAGGNAYDFSKDLSTIVYARPGGHADLYLLSQK